MELISEFSTLAKCQVNTQKSIALLYTNNRHAESKILSAILYTTL